MDSPLFAPEIILERQNKGLQSETGKFGPLIAEDRLERNTRTVIKDKIPQLKTLSPADRFTLAVELWDEILAHPETFEVTEEQLSELDRRYAAYQSDPTNLITWEKAKSNLL